MPLGMGISWKLLENGTNIESNVRAGMERDLDKNGNNDHLHRK